jgi:hypothetical protein
MPKCGASSAGHATYGVDQQGNITTTINCAQGDMHQTDQLGIDVAEVCLDRLQGGALSEIGVER